MDSNRKSTLCQSPSRQLRCSTTRNLAFLLLCLACSLTSLNSSEGFLPPPASLPMRSYPLCSLWVLAPCPPRIEAHFPLLVFHHHHHILTSHLNPAPPPELLRSQMTDPLTLHQTWSRRLALSQNSLKTSRYPNLLVSWVSRVGGVTPSKQHLAGTSKLTRNSRCVSLYIMVLWSG